MKKYLYASVFYATLGTSAGWAINHVDSNMATAWGYSGQKDVNSMGSAGEFIIDGSLGFVSKGSYGDEGAIVAVVAEQITEHGGFFCPYQIQCANARKNHWSWTLYHRPNGWQDSKCVWLCEKGYSGPGCEKMFSVETTDVGDVISSLRSGITKKTSGGRISNYESNIYGFNTWNYYWYAGVWNDHGEQDIILGAVKFLKNGILAAPVQVGCQWDGWKGIDSWVQRADLVSNTRKLLCKQGYLPNDTNTDCVPATAEAIEDINPVFCGNFPESGYNSSLHVKRKDKERNCYIYVCRDQTKAFPAAGKTDECQDCATSIKGGPNPNDGTCVVCNQTGQYFDVKTGVCKTAIGYSHLDLQYGKSRNKVSYKNNVDGQCWAKTSPDEYKECVTGKKADQQTE